ncbi:MAG: hypothetical protein IJ158_12110 [Treponema sp.]|nr:hypothetical protein [Treponema sp.]
MLLIPYRFSMQQKTNENSHEFFSKNNYAKEIASAFKETDDTLIKNFSALFCMQVLENSKIKQSDGIIILEILRTSLEKTIKNFFSEESITKTENDFDYKSLFDKAEQEQKKREEEYQDMVFEN